MLSVCVCVCGSEFDGPYQIRAIHCCSPLRFIARLTFKLMEDVRDLSAFSSPLKFTLGFFFFSQAELITGRGCELDAYKFPLSWVLLDSE